MMRLFSMKKSSYSFYYFEESGAFAERGHVHHKAMQGGASDGGLALTAYVVVALLENGVCFYIFNFTYRLKG